MIPALPLQPQEPIKLVYLAGVKSLHGQTKVVLGTHATSQLKLACSEKSKQAHKLFGEVAVGGPLKDLKWSVKDIDLKLSLGQKLTPELVYCIIANFDCPDCTSHGTRKLCLWFD